MGNYSRRQFMKMAGAGMVGLGLASAGRGLAFNNAWGDIPAGVWPANFSGHKILQIHLFGGMAPYESFYYRNVNGSRTRGFDSEVQNLAWNNVCANTPTGLELFSFSTDANTKDIHLGPFAKPLWNRQDIRRRMRVIVQAHNLLPHEAAIPYTLAGRRLGHPNFCGLGAAIQHRHNALDVANGINRVLPHAYSLFPENGSLGSLFNLVQQVAGALGTHPGSSRPLGLKIGPGLANLIQQLDRNNLGTTKAAVNDLINQYRFLYQDRLRWPASNDPTRSAGFQDYSSSAARLIGAGDLKTLLSNAPTTIGTQGGCALGNGAPAQPNPTKTALEFAAFLLTRPPSERASYVFVLDAGLVRTFLPYDVHTVDNATDTGTNLWNLLDALVGVINDPNGPQDPNKISLDDTMIIINTEFGRTPFKSEGGIPNNGSEGRDHWPSAYVNVLIGGPIPTTTDSAPGRVVGSIKDGTNASVEADIPYSATDVAAAALTAAGIDPFENENFALPQLTGSLVGANHQATMVNLRQTILGA